MKQACNIVHNDIIEYNWRDFVDFFWGNKKDEMDSIPLVSVDLQM